MVTKEQFEKIKAETSNNNGGFNLSDFFKRSAEKELILPSVQKFAESDPSILDDPGAKVVIRRMNNITMIANGTMPTELSQIYARKAKRVGSMDTNEEQDTEAGKEYSYMQQFYLNMIKACVVRPENLDISILPQEDILFLITEIDKLMGFNAVASVEVQEAKESFREEIETSSDDIPFVSKDIQLSPSGIVEGQEGVLGASAA